MKISGPDSIAAFKYMVGLYTIKNGQYRLKIGRDRYPVNALMPGKGEEETVHNFNLHENDSEQTLKVSLNNWSHRFFKIVADMDFPLRGNASMDEKGLAITVENMSPFKIIDCHIYFAKRFISFGNIDPAKKQVKRLEGVDLQNPIHIQDIGQLADSMVAISPKSLLEKVKRDITNDLLLSIDSLYYSKKKMLLFFGWIESNVISIDIDRPNISGNGITLLEWEIPVDYKGT